MFGDPKTVQINIIDPNGDDGCIVKISNTVTMILSWNNNGIYFVCKNASKLVKLGTISPSSDLVQITKKYSTATCCTHTVPDEKLNTSKKMTRKGGSRKNYNPRQVRWMGRNHYADI